MDPIITTDALSRHFGETRAVDRLSLSIEPGEVFGVLGHNGAGKTTTVRLLNGILRPTGGSAAVFGLDPATDGPAIRARTGVLTETPSLDDRLTGRTNLQVYANIYGVPRNQVTPRVDELLNRFGLAARAGDKVGGYSKGMRQRLALARILLHRPDLLFLDEPTAGLDPAATREVHSLIRRLSREEGATVFLCTHNLVEAQRLCSRVAVLAQGRLLDVGTPRELADRLGRAQNLQVETAADERARAMAVAEQLAGVRCTPAEPETHFAITGVPRDGVPTLVQALVQQGVPVYQVVQQEPSLEDVYFALQEGDGDGAQMNADLG